MQYIGQENALNSFTNEKKKTILYILQGPSLKTFKCPHCCKAYSRCDRLYQHMRTNHNVQCSRQQIRFACPFTCTKEPVHTMVALFRHCQMEHKENLGKDTITAYFIKVTCIRKAGKLYSRIINNYSSIINNCLLKYLELKRKWHEVQGSFRLGRSSIDKIFYFNGLIQGRKAAWKRLSLIICQC